uniref:fructose-bisphosphate aldolase n=1 Tax=Coccolithus braarudii TaxID=221442 RepID=A0A7S0Q1T1_9EUKA|mmetsp:Transcript_24926/g.53829  ORF Transcript_24926/g.53829 Transcript_24926/m.53829 type:complete len:356 (+) Transcript_24926:61-1128(+)
MAPCPAPNKVLVGDEVLELFKWAKAEGLALPAVNCVSSSSVNSVLEAAVKTGNPVIIQVSQGGGAFYCGKGVKDTNYMATIAGSVSLAHHVRLVAPMYPIPIVVHSDHCAKKLLPWFDGMLAADEEYFKVHGEPLFSSHMLDLSEETDPENIETCAKYFKRMAPMKQWLEMEIGITGGVEDGVDNSGVTKDKLYTSPEQVYAVYEALSPIAPYFSIAAAFGNVHGVYKPGNVKLDPTLLGSHQTYAAEKTKLEKPLYLVFHGGSGSTPNEIKTAVSNGVVKMNIDTDTQWSYWEGLLKFYKSKEGYLQGQIGNPDGEDKPNKSYYDPRKWLRECETSMTTRVIKAFDELGCKSAA